jgi:hypothetical protein
VQVLLAVPTVAENWYACRQIAVANATETVEYHGADSGSGDEESD